MILGEPRAPADAPGHPGHRALHLYVHVPFCRSRCAYCDFASEAAGPHRRAGRVTQYLDGLRAEWARRRHMLSPLLQTAYVGGGTPTALRPDELTDVIGWVTDLLAPGGECTVECDPADVDAPLLARLGASGVTRLSLGIQSFSPELRANLGRRTAQAAIDGALAALADAGWRDWNLDLVFAMPGQDRGALAADLDAAFAAAPTHISLYDLTYTPNYAQTVARRLGSGAVEAAADFADAHYRDAVDRLEAAGYRRYEVSNFARPGYESRHNQGYWRGEDYVGLGAGAVSTLGHVRWINPSTVVAYLDGVEPLVERLSPGTRRLELAMLGLRTLEGVDDRLVGDTIDAAALARLVASGHVERGCATLRLTPSGLDLSNSVLAQLLRFPEPEGTGRR